MCHRPLLLYLYTLSPLTRVNITCFLEISLISFLTKYFLHNPFSLFSLSNLSFLRLLSFFIYLPRTSSHFLTILTFFLKSTVNHHPQEPLSHNPHQKTSVNPNPPPWLIIPFIDFAINASNPYYLHPKENTSLILVTPLLYHSNYNFRSRAMKVALISKKKLWFIN